MSKNKNQLKDLNIEALFSSKDSKPHSDGNLDIKTLFSSGDDNFIFDSNLLLDNSRKRKAKLEETHLNIFKGCCKTIMSANESGITDIFYDVPENVIECIDYDPKICTKYVREKLLEHNINSLIMTKSKTKIFITWKDLEEKINNDNKTNEKLIE